MPAVRPTVPASSGAADASRPTRPTRPTRSTGGLDAPPPAPAIGAEPGRGRRVLRRAAVALAALPAGALGVSFGVSSIVELVTGDEAEHRFHQITGQGVLLAALWLGGVAPLVLAGLRRRRPSPAAAVQHAAVVLGALTAALLAPSTPGGFFLAAVLSVGLVLLWLALPIRPALRAAAAGVRPALDPVVAPLALLSGAVLVPFLIGQSDRQSHAHNEHAEMAHYYDMAWVSVAILVLVAVAGVRRDLRRRLLAWAGTGLVVLGGSAVLLTRLDGFGAAALALGAVQLLVAGLHRSGLSATRSA